jgi:capsular polysaccharide biosynthesis protein
VRSISRNGWQSEPRDDLPLSEILHIVWGWRLLVVGIVLALVLLALLFGLSREPVYTAGAVVKIEPRERFVSDQEKEAFVEEVRGSVVATDGFIQEVMRRAGWEAATTDFKDRLDFETITRGDETGMLVRFSGSDPEQAARAANAYAGLFVERVERLNEDRLAGGTLAADAVVEHRAAPPTSLRLLLYAAAAVVAGVLAGGAGALLLEGRARSWRGAHDAELTLRAPVLGVIPDYSSVGEED